MATLNRRTRTLAGPTALLLMLAAAGCKGGGSGSRDPILGAGSPAELPPTVMAVAPSNGAVNVPVNEQAVTAQFNMPVGPWSGSATFTLTTLAPGVSPTGTATLDATGTLASFTLAAATSLAPATLYTATLTGARSLATGVAMTAPCSWSFTTGTALDLTRPGVTLTTPATTLPGPTLAVPTNAAITATFTEAMLPATLDASSFTLTTPAPGVAPAGVVSYATGSRTASFTPATPLAPATTYTATLTQAVTDLAGNALAGNAALLPAPSDYVWTFTTGLVPDTQAPLLTLTYPANLATAVTLDSLISATFSKPMAFSKATFTLQATQPLAGAPTQGAVTYDALTRTATFTPLARLAQGTTYTAVVTGAQDLTGKALAPGRVPDPWTFTTGAGLTPVAAIALGSASTFGIMATAAITNTGATTINGDVSLDPGSSMTGFPPGHVNGTVHVDDTAAAQARTDLLTAFNQATALPPGTTISAGEDLGAAFPTGMPPGTYTSGSTMLVSTPLTLDAGGDANAVWVFQIGSSLTTSANVVLANGAQAGNVFWVPSLDATIGVGTVFYGTLLAGRNVTGVTGATINGRILAGATTAGTIALDTNTINVPSK